MSTLRLHLGWLSGSRLASSRKIRTCHQWWNRLGTVRNGGVATVWWWYGADSSLPVFVEALQKGGIHRKAGVELGVGEDPNR